MNSDEELMVHPIANDRLARRGYMSKIDLEFRNQNSEKKLKLVLCNYFFTIKIDMSQPIDKKLLNGGKSALQLKSKQMNQSGQQWCTRIMPELQGNYELFKEICPGVLDSEKNKGIGKLIISASPDNTCVILASYSPEGSKLKSNDWITRSLENFSFEYKVETSGNISYAKIETDNGFKDQDNINNYAFQILKKDGLYVEEDSDDDDFGERINEYW